MLHSFSHYIKNHKAETAYRAINGVMLVAVAYNFYSNPTARASEYLPDMAIHSFEILFPNDSSWHWHGVMVYLNMWRGTNSGVAYAIGKKFSDTYAPITSYYADLGKVISSTMPKSLNGIDTLVHSMNIYHRFTEFLRPLRVALGNEAQEPLQPIQNQNEQNSRQTRRATTQ